MFPNRANEVAAGESENEKSGGPEAAGGAALTHFNFQHKAFAATGARFALEPHSREPAYYVTLGDLTGSVEIAALKREFRISEESHDGKLIALAVQGLRYVPDIRPGDSIPTELIDGTASSSIGEKHMQLAQQRLQAQLLSWVSGEKLTATDAKDIEALLQKPESREKLRQGFREAAVSLGHEPDQTEKVMVQIETLAREMAYVEALRDRVVKARHIVKKLIAIGSSYGNDRLAKQELDRVQQLATRGVGQLNELLANADAQSSEIITALKSVATQVREIRLRRDALYMLLSEWKDTIADFEAWAPVRTPRSDRSVNALYRFLAPRFTSGQSLFNKRR